MSQNIFYCIHIFWKVNNTSPHPTSETVEDSICFPRTELLLFLLFGHGCWDGLLGLTLTASLLEALPAGKAAASRCLLVSGAASANAPPPAFTQMRSVRRRWWFSWVWLVFIEAEPADVGGLQEALTGQAGDALGPRRGAATLGIAGLCPAAEQDRVFRGQFITG